jgi:hypothetical protein
MNRGNEVVFNLSSSPFVICAVQHVLRVFVQHIVLIYKLFGRMYVEVHWTESFKLVHHYRVNL